MEKLNIIDKDVEFDDGVHSVSVNVGLEGLDSKKIFVFQRQLQLFKNKMLLRVSSIEADSVTADEGEFGFWESIDGPADMKPDEALVRYRLFETEFSGEFPVEVPSKKGQATILEVGDRGVFGASRVNSIYLRNDGSSIQGNINLSCSSHPDWAWVLQSRCGDTYAQYADGEPFTGEFVSPIISTFDFKPSLAFKVDFLRGGDWKEKKITLD